MSGSTGTRAIIGEPVEGEHGGHYRCGGYRCRRRLPIDDVRGSCVVICPNCGTRNLVRTSIVGN